MKNISIIEKLKTDLNSFFEISIEKGTKTNEEVYARMIFFKICKTIDCTITSTKLGEVVNKDHATVLYSLKKFEQFYTYDKKFKTMYDHFVLAHSNYLLETCLEKESALNITLQELLTFINNLDNTEASIFIKKIEDIKNEFINNTIENERVL